MVEAVVESAVQSVNKAVEYGLAPDKIIVSTKISEVPEMVQAYRMLAKRIDQPLHVGLTEAGMGSKGIVSSVDGALAAADGRDRRHNKDIAHAEAGREQGGGGHSGRADTPVAGHKALLAARLELSGLREDDIDSIPADGAGSDRVPAEADAGMEEEGLRGVEDMKVAVMGCVVNGPGESKQANIGISLPGSGENPSCPIFEDGKQVAVVKASDGAQRSSRGGWRLT